MDAIKVVYPAVVVTQKSLPGFKPTKKTDFVIVRDSEGHLLYHGILLCGEKESVILSDYGATKMLQFNYALRGRPICKDCEKAYKSRAGSPWEKWVGIGSTERNALGEK
jgi:hypothetical protein